MSFRLAVAQIAACTFDSEINNNLNVARIIALLSKLSGRADVLLIPELFVQGYKLDDPDRVVSNSLSIQHQRESERLEIAMVRRACGASGVACLLTFAEARAYGIENTAMLIAADKSIKLVYRKTHLWACDAAGVAGERAVFASLPPAADGKHDQRAAFPVADVVFSGTVSRESDIDGAPAIGAESESESESESDAEIRVGALICYDVEFPEPARILASRGADVLLVPTASTGPADILSGVLVPARAYENHVVCAYCNYPGKLSSPLPDLEGMHLDGKMSEELLVLAREQANAWAEKLPILEASFASPVVQHPTKEAAARGSDQDSGQASALVFRSFTGNSTVCGPDGQVLARLGVEE